jgi:polyhydroxyalkanoate synthesis regulator phasin
MKLKISLLMLVMVSVPVFTLAKDGERNIDRREARQKRRIEQGIAHGQLTPDEIAALDAQEKSIREMKNGFLAEGPLTKDEGKQLEQALNDASLQIWAQRHDTEGNQKSESRLGKDVFANDQITQEIESGNMTHAQARDFLDDVNRMVHLKHRLSTDDLTDAQRTALQNRYNDLLNQYFIIK